MSRWLLLAAYKLPDIPKANGFNSITKSLDFHGKKCENIIIMGDINTLDTEELLFDFAEEHYLSNLVNFPTCYESVENPSSIDLMITNKHHSSQNTTSFTTGLSDFHKLVTTSMKLIFPKVQITYKNMKYFDKDAFRNDLRLKLGKMPNKSFEMSEKTFFEVLDTHAPEKKKSVRASQKPYRKIPNISSPRI